MNNRSGIIYLATNTVNGKQYVGKTTKSLTKRIWEHINLKNNYPFHNAIVKYGYDKFSWKILCECSISVLDDMEKYYMRLYNTCITEGGIGYNIQYGGGAPYGDMNPSKRPEVRKKLSDNIKGDKNPMKIPGVKEKMINTLTGRPITPEHRKHISEGSIGKYVPSGSKNPCSKQYKLTYPNGNVVFIKGLLGYCRDNNLDYEKIRYAQKRKRISSSGFRCELIK